MVIILFFSLYGDQIHTSKEADFSKPDQTNNCLIFGVLSKRF